MNASMGGTPQLSKHARRIIEDGMTRETTNATLHPIDAIDEITRSLNELRVLHLAMSSALDFPGSQSAMSNTLGWTISRIEDMREGLEEWSEEWSASR